MSGNGNLGAEQTRAYGKTRNGEKAVLTADQVCALLLQDGILWQGYTPCYGAGLDDL